MRRSRLSKRLWSGKLYVKLDLPLEIVKHCSDSDDESQLPRVLSGQSSLSAGPSSNSTAGPSSLSAARPSSSQAGPSTLSTGQSSSSQVSRLMEIFPNIEQERIESALATTGDVSDATMLLSYNSSQDTLALSEHTLSGVFKMFSIQMDKSRRSHLEIDDVMDDIFLYYKDKEFNPKIPLKVHFTGQPGVDVSGLTRQLYTMFFGKLCNTTFSNHLFEGEAKNKDPVCRTDTCLSEIFVYVGVIIAHALSQGCRPPLHLSSAAY